MKGSLWIKIGLSFPRVSSNLTLKKSLTFYKRISSVTNQEGAVSKKGAGVEIFSKTLLLLVADTSMSQGYISTKQILGYPALPRMKSYSRDGI